MADRWFGCREGSSLSNPEARRMDARVRAASLSEVGVRPTRRQTTKLFLDCSLPAKTDRSRPRCRLGATHRELVRTSSLGFHPERQRDEVLKQGTKPPSQFGTQQPPKADRLKPGSQLTQDRTRAEQLASWIKEASENEQSLVRINREQGFVVQWRRGESNVPKKSLVFQAFMKTRLGALPKALPLRRSC